MAGYGLRWLEVAGNGLTLLEMTKSGKGWKCLESPEMTGNGDEDDHDEDDHDGEEE